MKNNVYGLVFLLSSNIFCTQVALSQAALKVKHDLHIYTDTELAQKPHTVIVPAQPKNYKPKFLEHVRNEIKPLSTLEKTYILGELAGHYNFNFIKPFVRILVEEGADVNVNYGKGHAPIRNLIRDAVYENDLDMVKFLRQHKALVTTQYGSRYLLQDAKSIEMANILLFGGALVPLARDADAFKDFIEEEQRKETLADLIKSKKTKEPVPFVIISKKTLDAVAAFISYL
jgi:hypothetical protein